MNFLENFPDLLLFFENYHIQGKIFNSEIENQLKEVFEMNKKYPFFSKNQIIIEMIIKELIQNCIKAHLKRWILQRYKLNPHNPIDYQKCLRILKHILYFIRLEELSKNFKDYEYYYDVFLSFNHKLLILHIVNEGNLFPPEEQRIRNKFQERIDSNNLYDYYLKYGDTEEGSGMGIAMIIMLLKKLGYDARHFVIFNYTDNVFNTYKTVSRVYIPFDLNYQLPRKKFDIYINNSNITKEELREKIQEKKIYLPFI
jgi:hypothetical protein